MSGQDDAVRGIRQLRPTSHNSPSVAKGRSYVIPFVRHTPESRAYFFLAARWACAAELAATAARMSCLKAASLIFSPSRRSIARRVFPSRLELKSFPGVFDGGSAKEGELHNLLVRFPCADAAVMGPDGGSHPFPLLLDVGVGIVDELTDMSEGLPSPIPQLLNPFGDVRGSGLAIRMTRRLHVLSDPSFRQPALCRQGGA